jgi:hypothetical protein
MRDRTKWAIALVALALAGGTQATAHAGNLSLPRAQYYSVLLQPGDTFRYTGTEPDYTLTVDDITYSVQISPGNWDDRSNFLTATDLSLTPSVIPVGMPDDHTHFSSMPVVSTGDVGVGLFGQSVTTGLNVEAFVNKIVARGAFLRLELAEGTTGEEGVAVAFDAISHSCYGQWVDKFKYQHDRFFEEMFYPSERQLIEPGLAPPALAGTSGWAVLSDSRAMSEAAAITSWAVPTSESRHYQSPQIVQKGGGANKVILRNPYAMTPGGTYVDAMAMVKGRVFFGTCDVPVENTDVTVDLH